MRVNLYDFPKLPASSFRYDNSVSWNRIPPPAHWDTANNLIRLDSGFSIVGWCLKLPSALIRSSHDMNQIGLMMFSKRYGEVWEHYPYLDDDDLESMTFNIPEPQ